MARYLSAEWFAEVAAAESDGHGPPVAVLEQVVEETPEGRVTYRVELGKGHAHIVWPVREASDPPDLRLRCDWTTAVAIASGDISTQHALAQGLIRVSGNPSRLSTLLADLGEMDPVPGEVRGRTTFQAQNG